MIHKKITLALASLLLLSLIACSEDDKKTDTMKNNAGMKKESAAEHAVKHLDPKYVCPMHAQIVRDKPGKCPICGMVLVKKEAQAETSSGERKILYYRHPHNPQITSDKPMKGEMGMDYVAIYDDGGAAAVKISPEVVQNMGVRTSVVKREKLPRRIDTVGYVDHDETRLSHIHMRTDGWIEKLYVKAVGERVKKGAVLFELYSPTLVNAQEEYLQALRAGSKSLVRASRERLMALGISSSQVKRLQSKRIVQQRIKVYAPQDGVVSMLKVREGMFIKPATDVMSLADLSSVWILAEVFEQQADWVKVTQPAEVQLSYLPGKVWKGKVEYVYPSLDPKTRTLKVRLRFDNFDEVLKPNMYANVTIFGGAKKDILIIPRESLIRTGKNTRVILNSGDGRFQPRDVVIGMESGEWLEVQSGLQEGDKVVTSGQFLIDSEASLKASLARMGSVNGSNKESMVMDKKSAGVITGTGILKRLSPETNKLNMSHDPIPALKWPAMTMDFDVQPGLSMEGLKPEDKITFELKKGKDGYVINKIQKTEQ
jgi:Cu(I)/Ag(I) efflux system membrane fusion protein